MLNENSSFYEFKKRIATLIIALLFLLFSIFFRYLKKDMLEYKLNNPVDLFTTINEQYNKDLYSYVVINSELTEFANNPDDEENSYYMLLNNDEIYVIFGKKSTIDNINDGYKLYGVTKKITDKFKNVILESCEERYNKTLTLDDFGKKINTVYLSTEYTGDDLTTGYNTLIVIFDLMAVVTFAYGFIGAVIRGIRRE